MSNNPFFQTVAFYTFGCKVNQYETEQIREQLLKEGLGEMPWEKEADLYVINSCTVTEQADKQCLQLIRQTHNRHPESTIVVTGCFATSHQKELQKNPLVDWVIPHPQKNHIGELVLGRIVNPTGTYGIGIEHFSGHSRAFIKIQDGCNKFCTFCIIPYVRGRIQSRSIAEIVQETSRLIENGYREIVLSGICIGDYGIDLGIREGVSQLLKELSQLQGKFRLRVSSIEPENVSDSLIQTLSSSDKFCKHLHIPFQSGEDSCLRRMKRRYTRAQALELVNRLRNAMPHMAISTDLIIGFPGETEDSFVQTLDFIDQIHPMRAHLFPFSKRKGTRAYSFPDEIPRTIVHRRMRQIAQRMNRHSLEYRTRFIGETLDVLVESKVDDTLVGYSDNYIRVYFKGSEELKKELVSVKILQVVPDGFFGEIQ